MDERLANSIATLRLQGFVESDGTWSKKDWRAKITGEPTQELFLWDDHQKQWLQLSSKPGFVIEYEAR